MRHTGTTFMLEAGVYPRAIQKLVGWTSMRMLERYGHVRDAELQRAVRVARNFTDVFQGSQKESQGLYYRKYPGTMATSRVRAVGEVPFLDNDSAAV
jgi:hypothetical protein